ncbi:hypothetical protein ABPG77_007257 [Micractinium sp. CCAP 211/92]
MFGPGHFGAAAYTLAAASVASVDAGSPGGSTSSTAGSVRRPSSPPQPVPRPRQQQPFASTHTSWQDALELGASPASSDAEQFLDASSEMPSAASSFGADADGAAAAMEEFISQGLPLLPAPDAQGLGASLAHLAANTTSAQQQLQQERQRREAAEAATAQLMEQMDEVAAQLFSFRSGRQQPPQQQQVGPSDLCASNGCSSSGNSPAIDVAALARAVLADAEAALAAERRRADTALAAAAAASTAAEGAAADAALVAGMVASMLARAAAAEDLGAAWRADKALLERRLERAAAMGQAVLKHRTGQSAETEPWRQQLLNAAFCVGCSILGAATAVLIIRRTHAAA